MIREVGSGTSSSSSSHRLAAPPVVIKRRKGNSYTHWISDIMQRFGTDASKTVTEAFKEPLELLARSPVLRTGEVLVVHSVDFESLRLGKLFKYMGLFVFFLQFSKRFLDRLFMRRGALAITTTMTGGATTPPPPQALMMSGVERSLSPSSSSIATGNGGNGSLALVTAAPSGMRTGRRGLWRRRS